MCFLLFPSFNSFLSLWFETFFILINIYCIALEMCAEIQVDFRVKSMIGVSFQTTLESIKLQQNSHNIKFHENPLNSFQVVTYRHGKANRCISATFIANAPEVSYCLPSFSSFLPIKYQTLTSFHQMCQRLFHHSH
jgi:hypothetical protein